MHHLTRRGFGVLAAGGAMAAGLGHPASARTVASPSFDAARFVHPELRPAFERLLPLVQAPLGVANLAELRARPPAPPLPQPVWTEQTIPGPRGAPDLRLLVVNARPGAGRPAILHMHGGGFVSGSAWQSLPNLQALAQAFECVIVSVDYRLAPETPFPGALEDNYAGLKWLYANAARLGADPARIAVMGESAGGGHAAMLAIAARDRGEIPLTYQALVYPMLDDRTGNQRPTPPYQGAVIWTAQRNLFGWRSLLGVEPGSRRVPYGAVPARVTDLKGLPPTYIGVGSIDLFVDEDIEYARRLLDVGVPVTLNVPPGAFHSFENAAPETPVAKAFKAALVEALRGGLERPA